MTYMKTLLTAAPLIALAALPAFGQDPTPAAEAAAETETVVEAVEAVPNPGNTTWMMISTILVLFMTVPGTRPFLRRAGARQEHAFGSHAGADDRRGRDHRLGRLRLLVRLRRFGKSVLGRPGQTLPCRRHPGLNRGDVH